MCASCIAMTAKHVLLDCPNLQEVRWKYFTASSVKDISDNVDNKTSLILLKIHILCSICYYYFGLWPPYVIGQAIYISSCGFFLSFFPRLISAVADWMATILAHMVWP